VGGRAGVQPRRRHQPGAPCRVRNRGRSSRGLGQRVRGGRRRGSGPARARAHARRRLGGARASRLRRRARRRPPSPARAPPRSGGLNDALTALFFMSPFFLVVVASVFAGDTVAGEANWGTLRYLLLRPVRRPRLLASKLAVAALMALVATLVIVVTGLVAGTIAFGWHPVRAGFFEISAGRGSLRLALATTYVAWGLAGVVSFAFLLSTLTDVPAGAFGGAIGLAIASQILD